MSTNWKQFFLRTTQPELKQLETASAWLGYTPTSGRTEFGERVGYPGAPWAGAFIDCVFHDAGLVIPSVTYPASGLAEFIKTRRVVKTPQPGDIVFFVFATGDSFGTPHVGLVTDTRDLTVGSIHTIEGDVPSGLAKSDPSLRGVFRRTRSLHDVLAFVRVQPAPTDKKEETGQPAPTIDYRRVTPGRRNKDIGLVQLALKKVTGLTGETIDLFDGPTRSAYARWQRITGRVGNDATGIPDRASLQLLGERTRKYKLDATPTSS